MDQYGWLITQITDLPSIKCFAEYFYKTDDNHNFYGQAILAKYLCLCKVFFFATHFQLISNS